MKIGNRKYTVESTETVVNKNGLLTTYTDLKGPRGADVVLFESHHDWGTSAFLFHFGSSKRERINPETIQR